MCSLFTHVLTSLTVIIAMDRDSPQSAGEDRKPPVGVEDLPLIRAFSDIAWMTWKHLAEDPKNIQYFMSLSITNWETGVILSRAIREVLPDARAFPLWSGFEFDTATPQGQAILGQ
jgi:hypothetical protein